MPPLPLLNSVECSAHSCFIIRQPAKRKCFQQVVRTSRRTPRWLQLRCTAPAGTREGPLSPMCCTVPWRQFNVLGDTESLTARPQQHRLLLVMQDVDLVGFAVRNTVAHQCRERSHSAARRCCRGRRGRRRGWSLNDKPRHRRRWRGRCRGRRWSGGNGHGGRRGSRRWRRHADGRSLSDGGLPAGERRAGGGAAGRRQRSGLAVAGGGGLCGAVWRGVGDRRRAGSRRRVGRRLSGRRNQRRRGQWCGCGGGGCGLRGRQGEQPLLRRRRSRRRRRCAGGRGCDGWCGGRGCRGGGCGRLAAGGGRSGEGVCCGRCLQEVAGRHRVAPVQDAAELAQRLRRAAHGTGGARVRQAGSAGGGGDAGARHGSRAADVLAPAP